MFLFWVAADVVLLPAAALPTRSVRHDLSSSGCRLPFPALVFFSRKTLAPRSFFEAFLSIYSKSLIFKHVLDNRVYNENSKEDSIRISNLHTTYLLFEWHLKVHWLLVAVMPRQLLLLSLIILLFILEHLDRFCLLRRHLLALLLSNTAIQFFCHLDLPLWLKLSDGRARLRCGRLPEISGAFSNVWLAYYAAQ